MKTKSLIGALVLIAATAPAMANHDGRDAGINQRQQQLEQRIQQGWRSGELTRFEYRRLQHEMQQIDRDEHAFRADGYLSPREQRYLHARLDSLAIDVHRQKNDGERRHAYYNDGYHADRRF
jgi:hypothetical protein